MITAGTRVGAYEIVGALGAGGMGEVYRARDTRLGREVALKILPAHLAKASSLARFEQEARHVAALNHPNIVALFDIGRDGEIAFTVSELVDGTTLRGAQLPIRKVTEIGAQIADALAAAHEAGVTHRDVKPDNVMVTRQGRVKVLDFGVAKMGGPTAGDGVTIAQTQSGAVVGTAGYMAPEQVRGGAVDARTDIFAVGALLYELIEGAPAFRGDTAAEIMTATLKADPPALPPDVPDAVRQIVGRCLEKNPEERFQSARDLAFALRQLTGSSITAASAAPPEKRRPSRAWIPAAAFLVGALVSAVALAQWTAARDAVVDPLQLTRLTSDRREEFAPAFSPDGRSLTYLRSGGTLNEVLVRHLDSPDALTIAGSQTSLSTPVWSPDGNQVCYGDSTRDFWCVGAAGGTPQRVLENVFLPQVLPGGDMLFFRVFEDAPWLFRQSGSGEPQRLNTAGAAGFLAALSPVSPDGASIAVAAQGGARWLVSLPGGERRDLPMEPGVRTRSLAWLPDSRHLVVAEEMTTLIGSRLVIQDTQSAARRVVLHTADHIQAVTASPDGARLVYAGGPVERDLVEYSAAGKFVRTVAASSALEGFPTWSPAGDRFVYRAGGPGQVDAIWLAGAGGAPPTLVQRMTSNLGSQSPISPDGGRIAFVDPSGIHVVSVAGGRSIRVLAQERLVSVVCWAADGESIWYTEPPGRLGRVPSGGGAPATLDVAPGILLACSPDGRWLLRRGQSGILLTSTDGTSDRRLAGAGSYPAGPRALNVGQFGEQGKVVYLLGLDRRTIDVLHVDSGQKLRTITFDLPLEDQIEGFAFHPDGTRALLSTGGDRNDLWIAEGFARPATSWMRWFSHWESPPQPK